MMDQAKVLEAFTKEWGTLTDAERQLRREYAKQFVKGRRFRVVKACRLTGMQPIHGAQQGWSEDLAVGDVLTCAGESMTYGDGVPAVKWLDENGKYIANDCTFAYNQVVGGMWGGQLPRPGLLEALDPTT